MVVKSTNRSRNDSDLPLRLPHNPEVVGSSPAPATKMMCGRIFGIFIIFQNSPHIVFIRQRNAATLIAGCVLFFEIFLLSLDRSKSSYMAVWPLVVVEVEIIL